MDIWGPRGLVASADATERTFIARVPRGYPAPAWESEANGILIAEAPNLLFALKAMVALYGAPVPHEGDHVVAAAARAAIEKAEAKP